MALAANLRAETGYDLWLRYAPLADPIQRAAYRRSRHGDRGAVPLSDGRDDRSANCSADCRDCWASTLPRVDRPSI